MTDLSTMTLTQLKELATKRGVTPTGNKTKKQTWVDALVAQKSKFEADVVKASDLAEIPTVGEFIQLLDSCETESEVATVCQNLVITQEAKYVPGTARKNLTAYRKAVQSYQGKPTLMTHQYKDSFQHCALRYLYNSEDIKAKIAEQAEALTHTRATEITEDIDCQEVLATAEKLLESDDLLCQIIAVQAFTGRRRSEVVLGKFIPDGDYTMQFQGQLKKHSTEDITADYFFPTLYDENKLDTVIERIQSNPRVTSVRQDCPSGKDLLDYVDDKFGDTSKKANEYFPQIGKGKGGSHKLRSFYACVIDELYEEKSGRKGKIEFVTRCLGDNVKEAANYLRFNLKNLPNLPLNLEFSEVGKKVNHTPSPTFDMKLFTQSLSLEAQAKFNQEMANGESIELILARAYNQSLSFTPKPEEIKKSNELELAFETMIRYNSQVSDERKIAIVPTSLDRVYQQISGKRMFIDKVKKFIDSKQTIINRHHLDFNIPPNQNHKLRAIGINVIIDDIARMITKNDM